MKILYSILWLGHTVAGLAIELKHASNLNKREPHPTRFMEPVSGQHLLIGLSFHARIIGDSFINQKVRFVISPKSNLTDDTILYGNSTDENGGVVFNSYLAQADLSLNNSLVPGVYNLRVELFEKSKERLASVETVLDDPANEPVDEQQELPPADPKLNRRFTRPLSYAVDTEINQTKESPSLVSPTGMQDIQPGKPFTCKTYDKSSTTETVKFYLRSFTSHQEDIYLGSAHYKSGFASVSVLVPDYVKYDTYS